MKIALLSAKPDLYANTRIREISQGRGYEFTWIHPFEVSLNQFLNTKFDFDLVFTRVTGVMQDDFDLLLIKHLEKFSKIMANPIKTHELVRNKLAQYTKFSQAGLSVTPYYSFRGTPTSKTLEEIREVFGEELKKETYIIKPEKGNQGKGVNIIRGNDSLMSWLETFYVMGDQKWVVQPFMDNSREIRFFIVKDKKPIILEKYISEDNFKGNFHQGATSIQLSLAETPQVVIDLAYEAFRMSGAYYASIDLLYRNNKAYILELNNSPGLREVETKLDIDMGKFLFEQ